MSNLPGHEAETIRIRRAYAGRDSRGSAHLYGWQNSDVLFSQYRLRATVASMLMAAGWTELQDRECLDVGCGTGAWLRTLMEWGAESSRMHGIDLLPGRIEKAKSLAPQIDFRVVEGWPLPFETGSMDMASAHTVFSSILDPEARLSLAREMMRVLRPDGVVLLYDFRVSHPRNPDTLGIGLGEVKRLFPDREVKRRSVTLAPPIQRPLARLSPLLAHIVEASAPFLRSHAVYLLRNATG